MTTRPTVAQFQAEAQFCRRSGSRHLFVTYGPCMYSFSQQRRGKITAPAAEILAGIFAEYKLGEPDRFFETLDRDLRLTGAKP